VSLAATTYYYQTKNDIIADASRALLSRYLEAFRRFAQRQRDRPDKIAFSDFAMKLVFNAAGKESVESLAWCEIILNTVRQPELRDLSQSWFAALEEVWREIATLLGISELESAFFSLSYRWACPKAGCASFCWGTGPTFQPSCSRPIGVRQCPSGPAGRRRLPANVFSTPP
jgi:AcrR family transcriptional regulator